MAHAKARMELFLGCCGDGVFQNDVPAIIFLTEVDQRTTFLTPERTVTLGRGLVSSSFEMGLL